MPTDGTIEQEILKQVPCSFYTRMLGRVVLENYGGEYFKQLSLEIRSIFS